MNKVIIILYKSLFTTLAGILLFSSCSKTLEVKGPKSRLSVDKVFADDITATAAITGIYQQMMSGPSFADGYDNSVTYLAAMSADELLDFYRTNPEILQVDQNNLHVDNQYILNLWNSMYKVIFQANSAWEGLQASQTLTLATKNQLSGEALFIRAFTHFYLVNLFGDVPIVTTTSYGNNAHVARQPVADVYDQIIEDLLAAKELMGEAYPTTERVRPTKYAAAALLARVYLFNSEWEKAEEQASFVLDNAELELLTDINTVFIKNSRESIWQIMPILPDFNTWEGYYFAITFIGPQGPVMNENLAESFASGDARLVNWIGTYDTGNGIVHFPYKYKADLFAFGTTEYSTVLRVAEQYLIRAEARAMQNKLAEAIDDVDEIRSRASLPKIGDTNPGISQDDLVEAIINEKRHELFTEWGHRWLDLKRKNLATQVLSPLKPEWSETDVLYPLPALEFQRNPKLGEQNSGY